MRTQICTVLFALVIGMFATGFPQTPPAAAPAATAQPQPPLPNPDSHYQLGPDSLPREGVATGELRGPFTLPSDAYPGTQHTYWVYVPAQYDPKVPASLMVFNDGQAFRLEGGINRDSAKGQPVRSSCGSGDPQQLD